MEKEQKVRIVNRAKWTKFQHTEEIIREAIERADPRGRTCPIKKVI